MHPFYFHCEIFWEEEKKRKKKKRIKKENKRGNRRILGFPSFKKSKKIKFLLGQHKL